MSDFWKAIFHFSGDSVGKLYQTDQMAKTQSDQKKLVTS